MATSLRRGAVVDRYEVRSHVGDGPAGPEYAVYDRELNRELMLFVLDALDAPESRMRFEAEVPKLASLRHPYLATVAAVGEISDAPYIVYDCAPGATLHDSAQTGMGIEQAVATLTKIAEAVDAGHRKNVVHGDLEPSTVLLSAGLDPVVTGMGLAPLLPHDRGRLPATSAAESSAYMAPEESGRGEMSPAADRYSFAGLAYELLSGSPPPQGRAHGEVDAESVPKGSLGPATATVLRKGLAPHPEARWASCSDMVDALKVAIRDDGAARRTEQRAGPSWLVVSIVVLLLVALGAGALYLFRSRQPAVTPSMSLSDSTVEQGGSLLVSGSGLPASQVGTVQLESSPRQIGAFQADQNGNLSVRVTIPIDTSPTGHVVSLCWDTCHASAKVTVTERPPASASPPSPSPTTPSPSTEPTPATPTPRQTPAGAPSRPASPS